MILKDHIQPAADRAAIGKVGRHTFRHYRASLKPCGTPLEVQKDLMRHADIRVTVEVYGLDQEVASAHRTAHSTVVNNLLRE